MLTQLKTRLKTDYFTDTELESYIQSARSIFSHYTGSDEDLFEDQAIIVQYAFFLALQTMGLFKDEKYLPLAEGEYDRWVNMMPGDSED